MKTYEVIFIKCYTYEVKIEDNKDMNDFDIESEALNRAFERYETDRRSPVTCVDYDDVKIEEVKKWGYRL